MKKRLQWYLLSHIFISWMLPLSHSVIRQAGSCCHFDFFCPETVSFSWTSNQFCSFPPIKENVLHFILFILIWCFKSCLQLFSALLIKTVFFWHKNSCKSLWGGGGGMLKSSAERICFLVLFERVCWVHVLLHPPRHLSTHLSISFHCMH